jgi:hypothetical protein
VARRERPAIPRTAASSESANPIAQRNQTIGQQDIYFTSNPPYYKQKLYFITMSTVDAQALALRASPAVCSPTADILQGFAK